MANDQNVAVAEFIGEIENTEKEILNIDPGGFLDL